MRSRIMLLKKRGGSGSSSWAQPEEKFAADNDQQSIRYWNSGRIDCDAQLDMSWCIIAGGTRAGGREVRNGSLLVPTNQALQMVPQVIFVMGGSMVLGDLPCARAPARARGAGG